MKISAREGMYTGAYALTLLTWAIWIAVDDDVTTYAPLKHVIVHHKTGDLYHWNVRYLCSVPIWIMFGYHLLQALKHMKSDREEYDDMHPILVSARKSGAGLVHDPWRGGVRGLANAVLTVFALNVIGCSSIWVLGGVAIIVMMTQNAELQVERDTDFGIGQIGKTLYDIFTQHEGVLFVFAFMVVIFEEVVSDKPCYWHAANWGVFFVWGFFNVLRLIYGVFTGMKLLNKILPTQIIATHYTTDYVYFTSMLCLILTVLKNSDLRCADAGL